MMETGTVTVTAIEGEMKMERRRWRDEDGEMKMERRRWGDTEILKCRNAGNRHMRSAAGRITGNPLMEMAS
jgi:hypothetical protein